MAGEVVVSKPLLILDLKDGTGIEHQPSDIQKQGSNDGKLTRIQLMGLVQVLIIQLDQLDALILLQSRELLELLSEQIDSESHGGVLIEIVEALEFFS